MKEIKQNYINKIKNHIDNLDYRTKNYYYYILNYIISLINIDNNNKNIILDEIKTLNQKIDNQQKLIDIITKNLVSNKNDDKTTIRELLQQILEQLQMSKGIPSAGPSPPLETLHIGPLSKGKPPARPPPIGPPQKEPPQKEPPPKEKQSYSYLVEIINLNIKKSKKNIKDAEEYLKNIDKINKDAIQECNTEREKINKLISNNREKLNTLQIENPNPKPFIIKEIEELQRNIDESNEKLSNLSEDIYIEKIKKKYNDQIEDANNIIINQTELLKNYESDNNIETSIYKQKYIKYKTLYLKLKNNNSL